MWNKDKLKFKIVKIIVFSQKKKGKEIFSFFDVQWKLNFQQIIYAIFYCSAQYKMYLKLLFGLHFLVLLTMWAKVGGEVLVEEFSIRWPFYQTLQLPNAYPWEYVWCFSFIPQIFAVISFKRNKVSIACLKKTVS